MHQYKIGVVLHQYVIFIKVTYIIEKYKNISTIQNRTSWNNNLSENRLKNAVFAHNRQIYGNFCQRRQVFRLIQSLDFGAIDRSDWGQ